jgi:lipoprotein-anchoring transpeptidase ErfK/SrfK
MKKNILISIVTIAVIGVIVFILILVSKPKGVAAISSANIKEAQAAFNEGNYVLARELYKKALEAMDNVDQLKETAKKVEELNIKILFSATLEKCAAKYTVKPGDTLGKISNEFNTTIELIKRANALTSDAIHPGQKLKVNICNFSIVVDKSQNLLFLKRSNEIIKTYVVSTGKDNSTPTGNFKIVVKQPNPTWFKTGAVIAPDSPQNILGTRWLGFDNKGYGIHGTTEPQNLGKQVTLGCVRMKNEDVEELYDIIPLGTEVTIVD